MAILPKFAKFTIAHAFGTLGYYVSAYFALGIGAPYMVAAFVAWFIGSSLSYFASCRIVWRQPFSLSTYSRFQLRSLLLASYSFAQLIGLIEIANIPVEGAFILNGALALVASFVVHSFRLKGK